MGTNVFDTNFALVIKHAQQTPDGIYQLVRHGRLTEINAYIQKKHVECCFFTLFVDQDDQKLTLLMLAALNGHDALVRMMLTHSITDSKRIEQEGSVYDVTGKLVDNVTALWCALDRRHFKVAHTLIDMGNADVDHGRKVTLLVDAVFRKRFDIIYFLVEHGYVDVNRIYSSCNCRTTAFLFCVMKGDLETIKYMIARGADINYQETRFYLTPLHVAAKKGSLESVQLLCTAGANSELRSQTGETPLMTAARCDHVKLADYLLNYNINEETLDNLEAAAALIMVSDTGEPRHRAERMVRLLRLSLHQRALSGRPKTISQPIEAYDNQQECQSSAELDHIEHDYDRLYTEALLIGERILAPRRNKTLFRPLFARVVGLVTNTQFVRALSLLLHVVQLCHQMNLSFRPHRLVGLLCRMVTANTTIRGDQFLAACYLVYKPSQRTMEDRLLRDAVCLVAIAPKVLEQSTISDEQRHSIIQWVRDLCRAQHRTQNGKTLLHLSVSQSIFEGGDVDFPFIQRVLTFPNLGATRLLLNHGRRWIDLECVDQVQSDTALHLISKSYMYGVANENKAIVDLLIRAGAHIDCVNASGHTPLDLAQDETLRTLLRSTQALPRLKCLCARRIMDANLVYDHLWPTTTTLNTFLLLHGGLKRKRAMSDDNDHR